MSEPGDTKYVTYLQPFTKPFFYDEASGQLVGRGPNWDVHYEKGCRMGSGKFGNVYRWTLSEESARRYWRFSNEIPSRLAIKEVDIDKAHKEHQGVEREIKIQSMASGHSNVVCFYGSFPLVPGKIIGIVMEHCDGNLKENMISSMETDNGRPRSLDEVSKLMRQIYKGLEHLHSLGIVHRDVKPDNILVNLNLDGSIQELKITDFGLSTLPEEEDRSMSLGVGSPKYASPEVRFGRKDYDERTDVWSVGIIALEMHLRICPKFGSEREVISKIQEKHFRKFLSRQLQWDPEKRARSSRVAQSRFLRSSTDDRQYLTEGLDAAPDRTSLSSASFRQMDISGSRPTLVSEMSQDLLGVATRAPSAMPSDDDSGMSSSVSPPPSTPLLVPQGTTTRTTTRDRYSAPRRSRSKRRGQKIVRGCRHESRQAPVLTHSTKEGTKNSQFYSLNHGIADAEFASVLRRENGATGVMVQRGPLMQPDNLATRQPLMHHPRQPTDYISTSDEPQPSAVMEDDLAQSPRTEYKRRILPKMKWESKKKKYYAKLSNAASLHSLLGGSPKSIGNIKLIRSLITARHKNPVAALEALDNAGNPSLRILCLFKDKTLKVDALYALDPDAGLLSSVWRPKLGLLTLPKSVKARKVEHFYSYNDHTNNFEQSTSRDPALADGFRVKKKRIPISMPGRKRPSQKS